MREVKIYRTKVGKEPFRQWLSKIRDKKAVSRIDVSVRRLALNRRGDWKRVGGGVFELRIHYGPGFRVYFSEQGRDIVLLLLGGDKSSQKRDIEAAIRYRQEYEERIHGSE